MVLASQFGAQPTGMRVARMGTRVTHIQRGRMKFTVYIARKEADGIARRPRIPKANPILLQILARNVELTSDNDSPVASERFSPAR